MPPPNLDQILAQWRLPGLTEGENTVAKKWLQRHGAEYDRIEFNVPIGPTPEWDPAWTEQQKAQANFLYSTKADIVGWIGDVVTIVEVKVRATKGALGQLLHYRYWFIKQHPEIRDAAIVVAAEWSDPGIAETTVAHGFRLELFGDTA